MKKSMLRLLFGKPIIRLARLVLLITFMASVVFVVASTNANNSAGAARQARGGKDSTVTPAAGPLTLVVNTLGDAADTNVGDGICDTDAGTAGDQCTLRAAIQETNAATTGTDVINFGFPTPSVITLTSALDAINGALTMNGPGADVLTVQRSTAPGTPTFRIFRVSAQGPPTTAVTISGLTITNGHAADGAPGLNGSDGGGIFNNGTLTLILKYVVIIANQSGDASTGGNGGGGGGIFNEGTVTLINSTVSGNRSGNGSNNPSFNGGFGGGIYNRSTMSLINCTISGNRTGDGGSNPGSPGGIGGGIASGTGLSVVNSTITGNQTGNGVGSSNSGGGGGIGSVGQINIKNTIVANNTIGSWGSGPDLFGGFNSQDYNLFKDTSGSDISGAILHNITGQDPKLGPLADNGGPTKTHALLSGSPALDAGNNAVLPADTFDLDGDGNTSESIPFDQRGPGFNRVVDGPDADTTATVDIGAFEAQPTNPIDAVRKFVGQHYLDFLNREADASGLAFWMNEITSCGNDAQCVEVKRINVSAAFYLSIEFQDTGYLVERIYKTAYGNFQGASTLGGTHQLPVPIVRLNEFLPDTQEIGLGVIVNQGNWQQQLENNKQAFTTEFVQRSRFTTAFPNTLTPAQFVDTLNANAGNPLSQSERDQLVSDLATNAKTRAQVLRAVAEDPDLNSAEFNRAFVLMQFFGYLRRNPNDAPDTDYTGYDFWLTKLNQFNGNFQNAEMVKAFISSLEYRQRFGP